jgi:DNA-directed RNA polymerase
VWDKGDNMPKVKMSSEELYNEQMQLERDMFGDGIIRFTKDNELATSKGASSETHWNRRLIRVFTDPLTKAIQSYLDYYGSRPGKPTKTLRYLRMLKPSISAYMALKVLLDSLPIEDICTRTAISIKIGEKIEDQVRFTQISETNPKYLNAIYNGLKQNNSNYRHSKNVLVHTEKMLTEQVECRDMRENGYTIDQLVKEFEQPIEVIHKWLRVKTVNEVIRWHRWPTGDVAGIGMLLLEIIMKYITMNDKPIIKSEIEFIDNEEKKGKVKYKQFVIKPTDNMLDWVNEYKEAIGALNPCYGPCVIPPVSWTAPTKGGYYTEEVASRLPLVSCHDRRHLERLTIKQMPLEYKAVNIYQQTPWTVNEKILDVLQLIVARDLGLVIPQRESYVDENEEPPIPEEFKHLEGKALRMALSKEQWSEFVQWKRETTLLHKKEKARVSKLLKISRTLQAAEKYRKYEKIYFVHTLDYRGRKYARSSSFGPQGDDIEKGLLGFANGVKLGERGLKWLAMKGADKWDNVYVPRGGQDKNAVKTSKMNYQQRYDTIMSMSEDIMDIASNPLQFKMWVEADKPVQFLGWCFEWAEAMEWMEAGNNIEDFVSYQDPSNDGKCSGIQHYSAMLRDKKGAEMTDLIPSPMPHDIYHEVAIVVDKTMTKISRGLEPFMMKGMDGTMIYRLIAEWLRIGIDRDLTKKSVMTLPYGSSRGTCRDSIDTFLTKLEKKAHNKAKANGSDYICPHNFGSEVDADLPLYEALQVCTKIVWDSIGEVVIAAREAMRFIKRVTHFVSKEGYGLEWITPTGFIVNQTIWDTDYKIVSTYIFGRTEMNIRYDTDEINTTKMKSSAAPNFVHSMDASHCTLLTCAAYDAGVKDIGVVHDEFRTHAGNTDELRAAILKTFVEMYQENDVLTDFIEYNEHRINQEIEVSIPVPEKTFDINVVLESDYAFG